MAVYDWLLVQNCPKLSKIVQNCPKLSKIAKIKRFQAQNWWHEVILSFKNPFLYKYHPSYTANDYLSNSKWPQLSQNDPHLTTKQHSTFNSVYSLTGGSRWILLCVSARATFNSARFGTSRDPLAPVRDEQQPDETHHPTTRWESLPDSREDKAEIIDWHNDCS